MLEAEKERARRMRGGRTICTVHCARLFCAGALASAGGSMLAEHKRDTARSKLLLESRRHTNQAGDPVPVPRRVGSEASLV